MDNSSLSRPSLWRFRKIIIQSSSVELLECITASTKFSHPDKPQPTITANLEVDKETDEEEDQDMESNSEIDDSSSQTPIEIKDYVGREADQEIDTVEICPEHPEFMVFGTYALRKEDEGEESETQIRRGFLQVMPVNRIFKPKYPGHLAPQLDKREFNSAVWDIHFHPIDRSLLGVATSNADMHFYRFVKSEDVVDRHITTKLVRLGSISFDDSEPEEVVSAITRFTWLREIRVSDGKVHVNLAISLSSGEVKIFKTAVPVGDQSSGNLLEVSTVDVHKHRFQAWAVALASLSPAANMIQQILLSGGDDSTLIATPLNFNLPTHSKHPLANPVQATWRDKHTHSSGVVAVIATDSLMVPNVSDNGTGIASRMVIPVLTGSYDDHIRLFEIDVAKSKSSDGSCKPEIKLATELNLQGGVWRIKIMDSYDVVCKPEEHTSTKSSKNTDDNSKPNDIESDAGGPLVLERNLLILVSAMYAGVKIVRATHTPTSRVKKTRDERLDTNTKKDEDEEDNKPGNWTLSLEAEFNTGHASIVYAADSFPDWENPSINPDTINLSSSNETETNPDRGRNLILQPRTRGDHTKWVKASNAYAASAAEQTPYGTHTVVSTSYYDMKVCVWKFVDGKRKACFPYGDY